jgi:hypothetical protein
MPGILPLQVRLVVDTRECQRRIQVLERALTRWASWQWLLYFPGVRWVAWQLLVRWVARGVRLEGVK